MISIIANKGTDEFVVFFDAQIGIFERRNIIDVALDRSTFVLENLPSISERFVLETIPLVGGCLYDQGLLPSRLRTQGINLNK